METLIQTMLVQNNNNNKNNPHKDTQCLNVVWSIIPTSMDEKKSLHYNRTKNNYWVHKTFNVSLFLVCIPLTTSFFIPPTFPILSHISIYHI